MDTKIIQDLTAFFQVVNTPLGVLTLIVFTFGIVPRVKKLRDFFGFDRNANSTENLKPILIELTKNIEKISGNDLVHVQLAIDNLGSKFDDRMNNFDDKLASHDKQAGLILRNQQAIDARQEDACRKLDALCVNHGVIVK